MNMKVLCIICLCIFLLGSVILADEPQKIVRAKIGIRIRSGDEVRRATVRERVKVGDRLRVYVIPEPDPAYIYVIHSDQKTVAQLNKAEQHKIPKDFVLMLPSPSKEDFYQIDGESPLEYITVICSPDQLSELEDLLKAEDLSYEKWREVEQKLIEQSQIDLRDQVSKSWIIAGAIKDPAGAIRDPDPFLKKLQIFSGKSLVVRKYEFRVKE